MVSLTIARSTVTTWRSLPADVWLLVGARAVNRLGAFTLPFLTVTLVAEQGASVAQAGYLMAAFGLATIPSRLLGGRLSDRWGARATIVAGLLGTAAAQLLVAGARTLGQAAVAVVLLGLAFEVYEPPSQSLVADATTTEQRPVAFGLLFAALAAAGMVAGLLAAVLAGVDLRWLFVADAVSCLACAGVCGGGCRAEPIRRPAPAEGEAGRGGTGGSCCCSRSGTGLAVVYLQVTITLPLTVTARGLPVSLVGLLLTVSAATVVLAQPLLAHPRWRRLDDPLAIAIGFVVVAAGTGADGAGDQRRGVRRHDGRLERRRRADHGPRLRPGLRDRAGHGPGTVPRGVRHQLGRGRRGRAAGSARSCSSGSGRRPRGRGWAGRAWCSRAAYGLARGPLGRPVPGGADG